MLPSTHFAENLKNLFAQQNVGRAMKNSLVNSLLQTFLALLVSSVAGYGFEVYHDKGKDAVMRILMLAMMVPFVSVLVPLFQLFSNLKLLNTVVGSIYIESLYSIPGMGGLLVTCVQRHDNTMVQGIVLLYACVGISGLILGDLLMVLIDPRINFGKKEGGR